MMANCSIPGNTTCLELIFLGPEKQQMWQQAAGQVMYQLVQDTPDSFSSANTVIWNMTLDRDLHWDMHRHTECGHHPYR